MENSRVKISESNEAYRKVLYWFFAFPSLKMGLNEIVKKIKISKSTANKIVKKFEKEGFLIIDEIGRSWQVSNNLGHWYNKSLKICYNLERVYLSGIIEKIKREYKGIRSIVLFGSYRKGDDSEKSDIDIAVERVGNKKLEIKKFAVIKNFGYRKNVEVNVHLFSRDKVHSHLFSNIINGIVLDGYLEVDR
jgi:predicted nucleotidyltransferase